MRARLKLIYHDLRIALRNPALVNDCRSQWEHTETETAGSTHGISDSSRVTSDDQMYISINREHGIDKTRALDVLNREGLVWPFYVEKRSFLLGFSSPDRNLDEANEILALK